MNLSKDELREEEKYLDKTIKTIREQISELGQQMYDDEEKQREFKEYMWNQRQELDLAEMKTLMSNNDLEINELERKAKHYKKLYKIQESPYFGRIVFTDEENTNNIYIGLTYLTKANENKNLIYDWRAPISNLFYDYELGKASFNAPGGKFSGVITKKRQFTIENCEFKRIFDNNLNINDEMLQEVLSKKNSAMMKNIVNTIQKEQNLIIRNVLDKVLVVQGIAGSGKTSVALHRVAFLLYRIKNLTSNKVLIFSPNNVFSKYISNVLPELGEENTKETTFDKFLYTYISEYKKIETFTEFVERFYDNIDPFKKLIKLKQSDKMIDLINQYIENYTSDIYFVNDIFNHEIYLKKEYLNDLYSNRYKKMSLYKRLEKIAEKVALNEFNGNKSKQRSVFKWLYESINKTIDLKEIYKNFYKSNEFLDAYGEEIPLSYIKRLNEEKISYEDACIFVYMKSILNEFEQDFFIEQVIIDEAQDYTKLQYILLKKILKKASFTILGDVNQTINPYYKYQTLEDLKTVFEDVDYIELNKTYRSSPEIIEYTNKILKLSHVSAIRRDTKVPVKLKNEINLKEDLIKDINDLKGNSSIAIITKTKVEANSIYQLLKKEYNYIVLAKNDGKDFSRKLIVIPVYLAKGLEFDATIIYTTLSNKFDLEEKYLFYVACTRSQHHLIVYNQ